ncbi:MAG TPA: hypothetical protein VFP26_02910 [Gemmatimonadaceae bacterium]|nr:hypothetical protein [Gemmatimonadaceae bacterium]
MSESSPVGGQQGPAAPSGAVGQPTHRAFVDPDGIKWQVWEIKPEVADRLGGAARVHPDLAEGWLCFESANGEKRRLAPVPADWTRYSFPRLIALWRSATPGRRTSR